MDPKEIFRNDKLLQFWPTSHQTSKERIEATTRFIIYASVIVYLLNRDTRVMILGGLVLGTLYVLSQSGMIAEGLARPAFGDDRILGRVTMPTDDNPWSNPLMTDYSDNPDRPPAAFYPTVEKEIKGVWDKIHPFARQKDAMRNFYTVPGNTIPNDQTAFAQACHGVPFAPMCRDTPGMCDPDKMFYGRGAEQVQMRGGFGQGGNGRSAGSA
jgi:hypothetical protein